MVFDMVIGHGLLYFDGHGGKVADIDFESDHLSVLHGTQHEKLKFWQWPLTSQIKQVSKDEKLKFQSLVIQDLTGLPET